MTSGKNSWIAVALLLLADGNTESNPRDYSKLWGLIDRIGSNIPLTSASYESVTGWDLHLREADEYSSLWVTEPIRLQRNLGILDTSLSLDPNGHFGPRSGATVRLVGACITVEDVKTNYGMLTIVYSPTGHSPEEVLTYRSFRSWGTLDFSFREIAPDCLSTVVISGHREKGTE